MKAEHAPASHETFAAIKTPERMLPTPEKAEALRPGEVDPKGQLEQIRNALDAIQDNSSAAMEKIQAATADAIEPAVTFVDKNLKKITLNRELKHIRAKLNPADKALSKVIHQPAVRRVSEASGKTLARPSGLFGGGLVAFIGTTGYLMYSKHIGLQYNYFAFLIFFAGGFAIGLLLEMLVWSVTRNRDRD